MKQRFTSLYITTAILLACNCAGTKAGAEHTIEERFEQGMEFLEKEKYLRAQDEFTSVLIRGSGTELGDDAQYYLGEAYFLNKEYILAISEYEKLTRKMAFSPFVEEARFKICEAYRIESPDYYHDQTYTEKALERYQEFLDDFPDSPYKNEVLSSIRILRNKVGEKEFETGILYMKMEEYESARMVFQRVDDLYYDTDVVGDTKLWIIKAYAKDLNLEAANQHLADYETVLKASELYDDALASIAEAEKKIAKGSN
tara:strand:+ start:531 stop:1301 length:771 start_codon:yes stop_codon:yes gene_type:complete